MANIVMHFVIPADRAPAPHMISGEPKDPMALQLASTLRTQIGHQGQSYRMACSDKIFTNEMHRATGEPWGLLEPVGNQVGISDIACQACLKTKAWQDAYAKFRAENNNRPHPNVKAPEEVMAQSSGGCC